jgi:hypothetical protein
MKQLKKTTLLILFVVSTLSAQGLQLGEARGLFLSVGVGPKIPIGDFSVTNNIGIGFDFTASYTDNQVIPVFLYTKLAYQVFPGATRMYKTSDYASFTTSEFLIAPGAKFYFPPVITDQILIMPIVEAGANIGFFFNTHVFKNSTGKSNIDETLTKFGFHIGGGFSMFFLEGIINYYFFPKNQVISFDLKIQVPIFAKI